MLDPEVDEPLEVDQRYPAFLLGARLLMRVASEATGCHEETDIVLAKQGHERSETLDIPIGP